MKLKRLSEVSFIDQPSDGANVIIEDNGNLKKTDLQMGITQEVEDRINNAQWKEETSTQLFSETVTTVAGDNGNEATLTYAEPISADTLKVTFNEVEYTCPKISGNSFVAYGGFGETGDDFTNFPFAIYSSNEGNFIYTETAGTYTVSASADVTTYTDTFKKGVNANVLKEVYSLSEADVAVVNFLNRVRVSLPVCTIQGNGTNVSFEIAPNALSRNFEGEHIFWKAHVDVLSSEFIGSNAVLYEDGNVLTLHVTCPTDSSENENVYTFNIYGSNTYELTSGYTVKYYSYGLTEAVNNATSGDDAEVIG